MASMVREGRGWVPRAAHDEGVRVARLLQEVLIREGMSVREVESRIGWGQKTLQQVLTGEQPIRISHVAAVLECLKLDVAEFYRELADNRDETTKKRKAPKKPGVKREIVPGELGEDELVDLFREFLKKRTPDPQRRDDN